jgi:hypothetical protein
VSAAFICVGNSDDKLPQRQWVSLQLEIRMAIQETAAAILGDWHSAPDSIYQNACWCIEIDGDEVPELKGHLAALATVYKQQSIAWNACTDTEFLGQKAAAS